MPNWKKYRECPDCGELIFAAKGKRCMECGIKRNIESIEQVRAKQGPIYHHWKKRLLKGMKNL